jgi:hypothetical protein
MIEVPLESGGSMLMEVELDESEQQGMVPAARGKLATEARQTFEEALHKEAECDAEFSATSALCCLRCFLRMYRGSSRDGMSSY